MTARTFVGALSCVRAARRFVIDELSAAGRMAAAEIAALLTSELATNVVHHAGTSFVVVVDGGLSVTRMTRFMMAKPSRTPFAISLLTLPNRWNQPGSWPRTLARRINGFALRLDDKGPAGKAIWFELAASPDASEDPH